METPPPEKNAGDAPQENLSRTMRIDLTPDLIEKPGGKTVRGGLAVPKRPTIRITRPKAVTGNIGDSDFQQLLQNVYDGAVITSYDGRIADANARLCQFLGYEHEELCRMGLFDLLYGADETLLPVIRENLANTRFVLLQAYFVRKDGSVFPTETAINRLYLSGQDYLCFFVRDITLRREAEEQLRTEHTAIQTAGSGIAIANLETQLTYVNPAIVRMWGAPDADTLQALTLHDLFDNPETSNTIVSAVSAGKSWSGEVQARRLDGTPFYAQVDATANLDSEDQLVGVVLSFNDVTERRRLEEQREQYAEQLRARNAEMEADLTMARDVQFALLPRDFPSFPRSAAPEDSALRFHHVYRPSRILGGDFFQTIMVSDNQAGVFVCDVMGHGMRAALITAIVRGLIEELKSIADDPGVFLTHMNREFMTILRDAEEFMFVSVSYLLFDLDKRLIRFADAGHPSPLLLQRGVNQAIPLRSPSDPVGPALGIEIKTVYESRETPMEEGDSVLVFTDGITEVEGPGRNLYGEERLLAAAQRRLAMPTSQLLPALLADAEAFSAGHGFDDDVCLLAVDVARFPER